MVMALVSTPPPPCPVACSNACNGFLFFSVVFGLVLAISLFILASDKAEAAGDILLLLLRDLCEYVAFGALLEAVFAALPMLERSHAQEIGIDQGEVKSVDITVPDCIERSTGCVTGDTARLSYGNLSRINALHLSRTSSGDVNFTLDISEVQDISIMSISVNSLYATVPVQNSISRIELRQYVTML
ncbi:uncharacterized protein BT62DRAFT_248431 [Guyanagaster necrorhizus]|uniref:Uncharacterized protein n=1 Tax=Guyanagaster necrorhizus TaxID=856835 RepID=A0A9P7VPL4_9AGAR|nr:uncharacterized protein BT62DRAFT_248431 [Guyanagaster necrorhizus MCA 3950]KAG7444549.1 hypothetical protein BT62DRAFT_248431 [Guyanagaster necrorhizus MCA 3950]